MLVVSFEEVDVLGSITGVENDALDLNLIAVSKDFVKVYSKRE